MRKSIFTLAVAILGFTNCMAAESVTSSETIVDSFKIKNDSEKFYIAAESTIFSPESVLNSATSNSIEDVIKSDQKITESSLTEEELPVFKSKSIEDVIADDNKITDANIPEPYALIIELVTVGTIKSAVSNGKM
ncbi:MAG TPA: hypothetical protein VF581_12255 [Flavobacterium sp.]|jgi:hypothetical protein